jgi:tRNA(Ile)-lysidine synthase
MRQARGDGRGLAGMAPATLFDGRVWIVRPLLATGRAELRRFLCAERIAWIEDPTNLDRKYERPRIRAALTDAGEGDHGRDALLARAAEAGRERERIAEAAARLVSHHAECPVRGLVRLRADFFGEAEVAAVPAFRALLAVCGGAPQFPDAGRALNLFRDMREGRVRRATLSRTRSEGCRRKSPFPARSGMGATGSRMSATEKVRWSFFPFRHPGGFRSLPSRDHKPCRRRSSRLSVPPNPLQRLSTPFPSSRHGGSSCRPSISPLHGPWLR